MPRSPSLTAFYDSLSPQQKEEFGHAAMHRMEGRMRMMMGMMGGPRPGMGGAMGRGPWVVLLVRWVQGRWDRLRPPPPPAQ